MPKAGRGFANCIVLLPAYLEMSNMFSVFSIKLTSGSGNRQCAQRGVRRVIACLRCVFRWSFSLLWKNFLLPHPGRFPRLAGAAFRSRCFFRLCRSLFQLRLGNFHPSLIQAPLHRQHFRFGDCQADGRRAFDRLPAQVKSLSALPATYSGCSCRHVAENPSLR